MVKASPNGLAALLATVQLDRWQGVNFHDCRFDCTATLDDGRRCTLQQRAGSLFLSLFCPCTRVVIDGQEVYRGHHRALANLLSAIRLSKPSL